MRFPDRYLDAKHRPELAGPAVDRIRVQIGPGQRGTVPAAAALQSLWRRDRGSLPQTQHPFIDAIPPALPGGGPRHAYLDGRRAL